MKIHIQQMSKSILYSTFTKKKSYGYYCNLCTKYEYPRATRKHFKPFMIMEVESMYASQSNDPRVTNYYHLIN